jgi:hypothetical protein
MSSVRWVRICIYSCYRTWILREVFTGPICIYSCYRTWILREVFTEPICIYSCYRTWILREVFTEPICIYSCYPTWILREVFTGPICIYSCYRTWIVRDSQDRFSSIADHTFFVKDKLLRSSQSSLWSSLLVGTWRHVHCWVSTCISRYLVAIYTITRLHP